MAPPKTSGTANGYANGHTNGHVNGFSNDAHAPHPSDDTTDRTRWRLEVGEGNRHVWHYLKSDEDSQKWPQSIADKYFVGLPTVCHRLAVLFREIF